MAQLEQLFALWGDRLDGQLAQWPAPEAAAEATAVAVLVAIAIEARCDTLTSSEGTTHCLGSAVVWLALSTGGADPTTAELRDRVHGLLLGSGARDAHLTDPNYVLLVRAPPARHHTHPAYTARLRSSCPVLSMRCAGGGR